MRLPADAAAKRRLASTFLLSGLVTFSWVAPAAASGPKMVPEGSFGTIGLTAARSSHPHGDNGFVLGSELSYTEHDGDWLWGGAYADAVYDFGARRTRLSLGPQLGWAIAGFDGGYVMSLGDDRVRHGVALRPMLTLGILATYFRSEWLLTGDTNWLGEVGILLKYPLELDDL